jgi:dienelactone hydrolase
MDSQTRRSLLRTVAGGVALLTAGCASDDDAETSPTDTPTGSPTASPTATATATSQPRLADSDPAELKALGRKLFQDLQAGDFQAAYDSFSQTVSDQLTPDSLENSWGQITGQFGAFVAVESASHTTVQGQDVVYVTARFERQQQRFTLAFDDHGLVLFRPTQRQGQWEAPKYVDQSAFSEQELTLSAPGNCSLGATLTLPTGDGPVPGVVLVHGSGPSDRDETTGPNKPFKDLAWGLASRGIAVLRYDKRTAACQVDPATITIDEVVTDDALTAVERLRGQDRVRAENVFVVGHSLGATFAPRIAARDGNLAGIVMLAPLARSVSQALLDQNQYLANLDGEVTETEQAQLDRLRQQVEQIRTLDIPEGETVLFGGRPYWETLQAYDPVETTASLSLPRLLLQGERDWQVTVEDDLSQYRAAAGDEETVTIRTYDRLNHLFMPGEGTPNQLEYYEQNNVARPIVVDVAEFVTART